VGGEGAGLPDDVQALADVRLHIPMRPPVESLNVAVAAGVILYEAYRQRHPGGQP
jgi:TrmH family RNA methyltransferase